MSKQNNYFCSNGFAKLIFSLILACNLININAAKSKRSDFKQISQLKKSDLRLFINSNDLSHDLKEGDFDLAITFDGRKLITQKNFPQVIKVGIYKKVENTNKTNTICNFS